MLCSACGYLLGELAVESAGEKHVGGGFGVGGKTWKMLKSNWRRRSEARDDLPLWILLMSAKFQGPGR